MRSSNFLRHPHFLGHFHFWGRLLKSSIFVVQKAAAPKNWIEFCQGSIGPIRSICTMSGDVTLRHQLSTKQRLRNDLGQTDRQIHNLNLQVRANQCKPILAYPPRTDHIILKWSVIWAHCSPHHPSIPPINISNNILMQFLYAYIGGKRKFNGLSRQEINIANIFSNLIQHSFSVAAAWKWIFLSVLQNWKNLVELNIKTLNRIR